MWEIELEAKLLGIGSVLRNGRHSLRGAAPTRGALFCGLVWEPCLGVKLLRMSTTLRGVTAIRRGARLLQVGVVLRFGVGAPSRGEAFSGPWLGKLS